MRYSMKVLTWRVCDNVAFLLGPLAIPIQIMSICDTHSSVPSSALTITKQQGLILHRIIFDCACHYLPYQIIYTGNISYSYSGNSTPMMIFCISKRSYIHLQILKALTPPCEYTYIPLWNTVVSVHQVCSKRINPTESWHMKQETALFYHRSRRST